MLIINDVHLEAARSAGTTPASAKALKDYSLKSFTSFLKSADEDLIIVGDLMDTWQVGLSAVLEVYKAFDEWLLKGHKLIVQAANHDLSTDSSRYGSLQFLMALFDSHPNVQFVINEGAWVGEGMYCVPHLRNQDVFEMELAKVPECEVLFLHANLDNGFAAQSDNSLNVSREQLEELPAKLVYFGHEHHARKVGKAFVGGVQWPTSVSDCLDKKDKFAYRLAGTELIPIKTWDSSDFIDMPWNAITETSAKFIRISGTAKPEEASAATEAVANLRRTSQAFVITNAVQVGTDEELQKASLKSLEAVQAFDVMAALKEVLTKEEYAVIEKL